MDAKSKTVSEHKPDGTFRSVTKTELATGGIGMTVTDIGTWKLDGDKLTLLYKDIDWKFSGGKPELIKKGHDRFKSNKPNIIAEANRTGAVNLVWKSNDEFEYTIKEGEKYIYRRQK